MNTHNNSIKAYLDNPISLKIDNNRLDFDSVKQIAFKKAKELTPAPVLLAWYDRKTGRVVPQVACARDDKPAWIIYAESRGGNIVIDINDEEYVFIYGSEG